MDHGHRTGSTKDTPLPVRRQQWLGFHMLYVNIIFGFLVLEGSEFLSHCQRGSPYSK
jgi:hypothetical protein